MRKLAMTLTIAAAIGTFLNAHSVAAQQSKSGSIVVEKAWSRATPAGAKVGAGYLTIENKGQAADRLVSASSPAADKVEIHEMAMKNGVMTMRELAGGVVIEPGKSVVLAPGGQHLMIMGLHNQFKQGEQVHATLVFEKAGPVDVTLRVEGVGASTPPTQQMQMPGMSGHKM